MIKNINNSDFILYTIKPGDNLYSLSIQFGTTIQDLINNNKFTIKEGVGVSSVNIGIKSTCSIEGYGNIILNITNILG